ncbi:serpin family protein [Altererythrobacter aquiaggeris]|uniref:serpin family protein n=1 Tax=Aestuarierythrobacter aquiaggeris TaxID=1898396 RepID=UPI00301B5B61
MASSLYAYDAGDPLGLWPQLADGAATDENIVYSPISTAQALGLVHLGAQGQTARQIEAFLDTGPGDAADRSLAAQREQLMPMAGSRVRVKISNALFLSDDFNFRAAYTQGALSLYAAETMTVDFDDRPADAAAAMNRWADRATEGLIAQVTEPAAIKRDAAAYLINATFFEGAWSDRFTKIEASKFLFGDGEVRPFKMMSREGYYATARSGGWKGVRLPYGEQRYALDLMLPEQRLSTLPVISPAQISALGEALGAAGKKPVRPIIPRFQASMRRDLIPPLSAVGLSLPFDRDRADLTAMIEPGGPRLFIDDAFQMAKLEVFETGTRAAAVTVMVPRPISVPPPFEGEDFRVDRPFLFALRDLETGAVLFFGRIMSPEAYTGSADLS